MHINLIARTNGVGLDADVALLKHTLEQGGLEITVSHSRGMSLVSKWTSKKNQFDANIFLERAFPNWFNAAPINLLIPNQERYPHRHLKRLDKIDFVLCKTKHAEEIFSEYAKTKRIGFTSKDLNDSQLSPDYQSFFHLAGRSTLKGTETILKLWKKHPEWPTLTLIQHKENAPTEVPANVNLIAEYLAYDDLLELLNKSGVHLCPSLSEGWGHYIVEAMSSGAVVITTDAPPMNELISASRGLLVPFNHSEPRHLGTNFYVNPDELESSIENIIATPVDELAAIGLTAQQWYHSNHVKFEESVVKTIKSII